MSLRGIYTNVNDIRERVYEEVARLSYEYNGDLSPMHRIPYDVIPGSVSNYRDSVFLERAIVRERVRLAMGLNLRTIDEYNSMTDGAEECVQPEKYYQPPLINIIKFACNRCPDNELHITDVCQGCLAHPCIEVCPKGAIKMVKGKSEIDQNKCVKCGKCKDVCPYGAIVKLERPCAKACGMHCIGSDYYGYADIDYDNCVSCGQCLAHCPFGAIADKAQIFQVIQAIRQGEKVYAAIAPAVTGQFGKEMTPEKIRSAFKALGFEDAIEVAIGADLCTIQEGEDFVEEVPAKMSFMGTSCCPAWAVMAKKQFPELAHTISMALTPMVLTGRLIKKSHPGCKVAFIGPCSAKKLEASRSSIRSDIDFVLTFEEVMGMLEAKDVKVSQLESGDCMHGASAAGRGFAVSGGVAEAVKEYIETKHPEKEFNIAKAEGLDECRKMLRLAKAGKYDGYLLEGMACPGGCIAGVGTVQPINQTAKAIERHQKVSTAKQAVESDFGHLVDELSERDMMPPK